MRNLPAGRCGCRTGGPAIRSRGRRQGSGSVPATRRRARSRRASPRNLSSIPSGKRTAAPPEATAVAATSTAPPSAPRLPMRVMPPLAPTATVSPKNSSRGGVRLRPPRLVAQVSAAAAARLPVTTHRPELRHQEPEQGAERRRTTVGPHLPRVAALALGIEAGPGRAQPSDDGAGDEKGGQDRAAAPPRARDYRRADQPRGDRAGPRQRAYSPRGRGHAPPAASAAAGGDTGVSRAPSRRGGGSRSAREAYRGSRTSRLAARAWRGSAARSGRG